VPIGSHLHQPYGVVYGGVYAAIAESLCSWGAAAAAGLDRRIIGTDNQTSFLRAARDGSIAAVAVPVHTGRRTQLWEAELRDDGGKLLAVSRVRLLVMDEGASLAGQALEVAAEEAP
jgi:1,4-dihydroxy-2-naphthoyl-CoA hydrolase